MVRYLDRELEPELIREIEAHLLVCPACRSYFESESGLEKNIVSVLGRPEVSDDAVWAKALSELGGAEIIKPRRLGYYLRLASAAAIMMAAGIFFLFQPTHQGFDLLEASEQAHQPVLCPDFRADFQTDSHDELNGYFNGRYQVETPGCGNCLGQKGDCRLRGGRMCRLKERRVPHIIMEYNDIPISVLVLSEEDLDSFPEAASRLSRCFEVYTASRRGLNYAMVRIDPNVVCAVSQAGPEILARVLDDMGATTPNCRNCPKSEPTERR